MLLKMRNALRCLYSLMNFLLDVKCLKSSFLHLVHMQCMCISADCVQKVHFCTHCTYTLRYVHKCKCMRVMQCGFWPLSLIFGLD